MPTRYTLVCDDDVAERVRALSRKHDITEEEALRQLVDLGLDALDDESVA
jgi:hypothetical protein